MNIHILPHGIPTISSRYPQFDVFSTRCGRRTGQPGCRHQQLGSDVDSSDEVSSPWGYPKVAGWFSSDQLQMSVGWRVAPAMWAKECHKQPSPSHHHKYKGGMNLPFPVMGGL